MKMKFFRRISGMLLLLILSMTTSCLNRGWSEELPPQGIGIVCDSQRIVQVKGPGTYNLQPAGNFVAWKGEALQVQLLAYSFIADSFQFKVEAKNELATALLPSATLFKAGWQKGDKRGVLYADSLHPIVDEEKFPLAEKNILPLWMTFQIPATANTGVAQFELIATTSQSTITLPISIEVLDLTLPPIAESDFYLDLWQNPFSIARYYDLEVWSDAHFEMMRPFMEKLAAAGQRVITATIIDKPWNGQTYDPFKSMVQWTKTADGSFTYDYTIFDKWVEFAMSCGIDEIISCYTMIPWHNRFLYFDESTQTEEFLMATPGSSKFNDYWKPFLIDFQNHLVQKGWEKITSIAMDERPEPLMRALIDLVNETAPDLKITTAFNHQTDMTDGIYDISMIIQSTPSIDQEWIDSRTAKEQKTTYYVCVSPPFPNTFTHSDPAEAQWLGWYVDKRKFSGFLRWAYNSWPADPLVDTSFGNFPDGDTFFVYPGKEGFISSVRFEKLIDGIEDWIKIQECRKLIAGQENEALFNAELNKLLAKFVYNPLSSGHKAAIVVKQVEKEFNELVKKFF